jgi:hypothetical protein
MKINYNLKLGKKEYTLEIKGKTKDGKTYLEGKDTIKAHKNLALKLLEQTNNHKEVTPELFSFFVDTCALRNVDVAKYLNIQAALISQYRKDKNLSALSWTAFRSFFWDFITHEKCTNPIYEKNFYKKSQAA